jgi:diketogulonate reductase-like aldo/keto reductase
MLADGTRFQSVRGFRVPRFLYGTAWKEERTQSLTQLALAAKFRGIDTANQRRHYVEAAVGAALKQARAELGILREDVFIQTKFTYARGQDQRLPYDPRADVSEQVRQSFESSLGHLGTDYVDSLLLHGPSKRSGLDDTDWRAWQEMERLARAGKARLIGISNVSAEQLELLVQGAEVKPAFVQNRCYAASGWDEEVRDVCRDHDVVYQGFSLLTANQTALNQPALGEIVLRSGRTLQQVVFRFALQLGMLPLTGTSSPEHMRQAQECFEFELPQDDVQRIQRIGLRR